MIRVSDLNGKIIISDFSKKGFRVVSDVHRSEGRHHDQGNATVNDINRYFSLQGWSVQKHRTVFQETIVACRKKEKLP